MLVNYLKLAFRLLIQNPFFTFINVLGLSVGQVLVKAISEPCTRQQNLLHPVYIRV